MSFEEKKRALLAQLGSSGPGGASVGLAKSTSNLFRDRQQRPRPRVDLSHFNQVVRVEPAQGFVDAEGMVRYVDLVDATLAHGCMPAVVPQLKSITLGGAVAGVGIESTSFRHGLVHDTVLELEVLTGDGRIVRATLNNEHRDLFASFPNSYGTLGYALKVRARTIPVKPFVQLEHVRHTSPSDFFAQIALLCETREVDFLDGVVFAPGEMYLTLGRFVEAAPYVSDYKFEHIYYRSIATRTSDYLSVRDYIWRWDTDWFWCSKNLGAQNAIVRRLFGRSRLNSITYQKIMRWNSRWGITRALNRVRGLHTESVIQDVDIPIDRAAEFLQFFLGQIRILPIWICPIRAPQRERFPLYQLHGSLPYINFGFWDVIAERQSRSRGYHNRRIEQKVRELGGIKSLYSDSYYTPEEFWASYDRNAYARAKASYDPAGTLKDLYDKCVLRG